MSLDFTLFLHQCIINHSSDQILRIFQMCFRGQLDTPQEGEEGSEKKQRSEIGQVACSVFR